MNVTYIHILAIKSILDLFDSNLAKGNFIPQATLDDLKVLKEFYLKAKDEYSQANSPGKNTKPKTLQELVSKKDKTPVGTIANDETPISFGKYKGSKLKDVPAGYLIWCLEQDWFKGAHPAIYNYIYKYRELLGKEVVRDNNKRFKSVIDHNEVFDDYDH